MGTRNANFSLAGQKATLPIEEKIGTKITQTGGDVGLDGDLSDEVDGGLRERALEQLMAKRDEEQRLRTMLQVASLSGDPKAIQQAFASFDQGRQRDAQLKDANKRRDDQRQETLQISNARRFEDAAQRLLRERRAEFQKRINNFSMKPEEAQRLMAQFEAGLMENMQEGLSRIQQGEDASIFGLIRGFADGQPSLDDIGGFSGPPKKDGATPGQQAPADTTLGTPDTDLEAGTKIVTDMSGSATPDDALQVLFGGQPVSMVPPKAFKRLNRDLGRLLAGFVKPQRPAPGMAGAAMEAIEVLDPTGEGIRNIRGTQRPGLVDLPETAMVGHSRLSVLDPIINFDRQQGQMNATMRAIPAPIRKNLIEFVKRKRAEGIETNEDMANEIIVVLQRAAQAAGQRANR